MSQIQKDKQVIMKQEKQLSDVDNEDEKKLSKGQRKKLRQRKKKQEQKKQQKIEIGQNEEKEEKEKENVEKEKDKGEEEEKKVDKKKNKKGKVNAAAMLAKKKYQEQLRQEEELERKKKEFEEEQERIRIEEEKRLLLEKEKKQRQKQIQKQKKKEQKKKGIYVSKKDKEKLERIRTQLEHQSEDQKHKQEQIMQIIDTCQTEEQMAVQRIKLQKIRKKQECSLLKDDRIFFALKEGEFRSPVCVILGHVDTGKTTLLDKIRHTNVQQGEAGGITQQIGATFFPQEKLLTQVNKCSTFSPTTVQVPGLLIIDTPGHESFANLRSRGSSLCDIAILVIDLMHGLENQTIESLELLSKRNTPFIVALNKIDRSYNWQNVNDSSSYLALKRQKQQTIQDYQLKLDNIIMQLNEKGYNAAMYWKNPNPLQFISLVPTSGITGQGIPDLLTTIIQESQSQERIVKRIKVKKDKFNATIMEVKMIEGYGMTIDCLLVDGVIRKDDQIVLLSFSGPIITKVKAILTPHPMKQMRIKDEYLHHEEIYGANGLKIAATGLDEALAGSPLIVVNNQQQIQDAYIICQNEYDNVKKKIKLQKIGVGVSASTLGSLQALLDYLNSQKIPVSHISVGPVSKDDVVQAMKSLLSQNQQKRKKQYASLLVFDVKILNDAKKYAQQNDVKIFTANIIYHLTDQFNKYTEQQRQIRKLKQGKYAVFPCVLKQVAVFRKSDQIVLGIDVQYGVLRIGTPLCLYRQKQRGDKQLKIGIIDSIQHNHKKIKQARKITGSVAISISGDSNIIAGKQFQLKDRLVSIISRKSIDCLKQHYKNQVKKQEWVLLAELKKYFNVN